MAVVDDGGVDEAGDVGEAGIGSAFLFPFPVFFLAHSKTTPSTTPLSKTTSTPSSLPRIYPSTPTTPTTVIRNTTTHNAVFTHCNTKYVSDRSDPRAKRTISVTSSTMQMTQMISSSMPVLRLLSCLADFVSVRGGEERGGGGGFTLQAHPTRSRSALRAVCT